MAKPKRPRNWHPEDIKAAVRKAGWTLTALSLANGLPEHSCRHACRHPNFEGEIAIARVLGIAASQIWPNRFFPDGTRRHQRRQRLKATTSASGGHCQNIKAA